MCAKQFFGDDYLLDSPLAIELYEKCAKTLPIFDYHCHLSPRDIALNRVYENIGELWLECDHYKWRMMRACGVDEAFITGDKTWHDKFIAFAGIMPKIIGSPVYAWAHLELKNYFDICEPLNPLSAEKIWAFSLKKMSDGSFSAQNLIRRSNVEAIFTTDDPADSLQYHEMIKENPAFSVCVLPSFRPDMICTGLKKADFVPYASRLLMMNGAQGDSFDEFVDAVLKRLDFFVENGCIASDISLAGFSPVTATHEQAQNAYNRAIQGEPISDTDDELYCDYMLHTLAGAYSERNMVMQLHLSAIRNNNTLRFNALGADCGNDSVGKFVDINALSRFLDTAQRGKSLPKTIIYTLNSAQYYEIASMIGNFWENTPGKLQLGAAWWFCDHTNGIREQLKMTAATGALGLFNGMLTDSRSFTSYPRHDYFRRILCSEIASYALSGEYDPNFENLCKCVFDICIGNARKYFNIHL